MNARDYEKLNKLIGRIQNDPRNIENARYKQRVINNEIIEPSLYITMSDYRTLCKMCNVYDTLSKKLVNGQLVSKED